MASQAELLLWVLATLVVALSALNIRLGWRWAWGYFVQMAGVLALCVAGIALHAPIPFALAAYGAFGLFVTGTSLLLRRFARLTMVESDPIRAARVNRLLRLLSWGPPARLRETELEALCLALAGDRPGAVSRLTPYLAPSVPERARVAAASFAMMLFRFDEAWDEAVAFADTLRWPEGEPVPHAAAFVVARAHLELGQYDRAIAVMDAAELASVGLPASALEVYRLPFAALMGDLDGLRALVDRLGAGQATLTRSWLARCYVTIGRYDEAKSELEALLAQVPAGSYLAGRLQKLRDSLETDAPPSPPPATPAQQAAVRALFETAGARTLFDARRPSRLTIGLVALNAAVFVGVYAPEWLGDPALTRALWTRFVMWMPAVQHGEWWRLFTHQVMHQHLTHLALNLATLWVLGSMAVRLVGPWWFLPIYLAAGVAGGLAQGLLSPDTACLGASGAIFGALGMVAIAVLRDRGHLPERWRKRFLRRLGAVLLLQLGADWLIPGVAAVDHLAGLVAGALLTLLVPLPKPTAAAPETKPDAKAA